MEIKKLSTLIISLTVLGSLPALASSNNIGTDYLMSQTTFDPTLNTSTKFGKKTSSGRFTAQSISGTPTANTQEFPTQILKTGVSLSKEGLSPNSMQLCDNIGLSSTLTRIGALRGQLAAAENAQSLTTIALKQDLFDETLAARMLVQKVSLEIDFTVAEIEAERQVYHELLTTFKNDRDKAVARTNAFAFISNGILWAVCESFVIPTYKHAIYNIPAGIVGIPAGVVPSIASMYTFKQINGKKKTSEVEPNMLAKVFDYPTNPEIEYPKSVWTYLNQVPADSSQSKNRLNQMVDRWIADSNMPAFTDKNSKKQLDVLTASAEQKKSLTIATLTARSVMLDQLLAEINKMKRMLLELDMVVAGNKQFIANGQTSNSIQ